jgi:hypothetical protein
MPVSTTESGTRTAPHTETIAQLLSRVATNHWSRKGTYVVPHVDPIYVAHAAHVPQLYTREYTTGKHGTPITCLPETCVRPRHCRVWPCSHNQQISRACPARRQAVCLRPSSHALHEVITVSRFTVLNTDYHNLASTVPRQGRHTNNLASLLGARLGKHSQCPLPLRGTLQARVGTMMITSPYAGTPLTPLRVLRLGAPKHPLEDISSGKSGSRE